MRAGFLERRAGLLGIHEGEGGKGESREEGLCQKMNFEI